MLWKTKLFTDLKISSVLHLKALKVQLQSGSTFYKTFSSSEGVTIKWYCILTCDFSSKGNGRSKTQSVFCMSASTEITIIRDYGYTVRIALLID